MCTLYRPTTPAVGAVYVSSHGQEMRRLAADLDYYELVPEALCREVDLGCDRPPALSIDHLELREAVAVATPRPIVVRGASLSIGSPEGPNESMLELLDELAKLHPFAWANASLSFSWVDGRHLGAALPLPYTREAATIVADRARAIVDRLGRPLLLENVADHLPDLPRDRGWDEIAFLNEVAEASSCGLSLDLDGFLDNCRNHGTDPRRALARLDAAAIEQIRLGPARDDDDVHKWSLLEWLVGASPRLRGVTIDARPDELLGTGVAALRTEIANVRRMAEPMEARIACH